jgi:AraC-like DNA-binding protein
MPAAIEKMEHHAPRERDAGAWYREFVPCPALQDSVRALFSFTSHPDPDPPPGRAVTLEMSCASGYESSVPLFADGNASIVFDAGMVFYPDGIWRDSGAFGGRVIGAMSRVKPSLAHGMPAAVGAFLRPGRLSHIARMPASEVTDLIVPIDDVWGRSASRLSERLVLLDERTRLDLLERTLLAHLTEPRERRRTVDVRGLAACVVRRRGRISVDALATAAGVSRQQLTRTFRERVGVTPKLYCRLARFQSALAYVRPGDSIDWARVALEAGYADQSHMIAEFRQFSSLTPSMLTTGRWFHPFIERAKHSL